MNQIAALMAGLMLCLGLAAAAQAPPTVATFQQVLEKRLLALRIEGYTERQVLFQSVRQGRPAGASYPFQATVLIRDYGPGYPKNRYFGQTCVARLENGIFTLVPNSFGEWTVEGAMTPPMSATVCKPNPSEGASSFPLATLSGTPAAGGPIAQAPAAPQGRGGVNEGTYECWANGQARPLLNFNIRSGGSYLDSEGKSGTYSVDPASGRITFRGGGLDGVLPAGFYMVYGQEQGRPKVSFRNRGGDEITFCEWRR